MSKRKRSTESIGSLSFDFNLCLYCQRQKKIIMFVQVVCSVKTMMQMLHTQKQPPTLKDLSDWFSHQ